MNEWILTCDACGHEMRVTELAIGTRGRCAQCGAIINVNHHNTRPLEDEIFAPPHKAKGNDLDLYAHSPDHDLFDVPEEQPPSEPEIPTFAKGYPGLFRAVLWTTAIFILAASLIVSWMPEPELTPEETAQIKAAAIKTYHEASPIKAYRKELGLALALLVYVVIVLYHFRAHVSSIRRESDDGWDMDLFCLFVISPLAAALPWVTSAFPLDQMGLVFLSHRFGSPL